VIVAGKIESCQDYSRNRRREKDGKWKKHECARNKRAEYGLPHDRHSAFSKCHYASKQAIKFESRQSSKCVFHCLYGYHFVPSSMKGQCPRALLLLDTADRIQDLLLNDLLAIIIPDDLAVEESLDLSQCLRVASVDIVLLNHLVD
jgi:hypothetical protein